MSQIGIGIIHSDLSQICVGSVHSDLFHFVCVSTQYLQLKHVTSKWPVLIQVKVYSSILSYTLFLTQSFIKGKIKTYINILVIVYFFGFGQSL